jgi:hypothetical protein
MKILFALVFAVLLASPDRALAKDAHAALDKYLPYAGEPVDRFQFTQLQKWVLLDEYRIVVWPRLNQAFLLRVDPPCQDLEWAHQIGLTSSANVVSRRFDSVIVGDDKCRINEIRPLDLKAMNAATGKP